MAAPRRSRTVFCAAIALLLAGCAAPLEPTDREPSRPLAARETTPIPASSVPPDPEPIPRRRLYPLDVGNRWDYQRTIVIQIIPIEGPPGAPSRDESSYRVTLPCALTYEGLDYVVQLETQTSPPSPGSFYLRRQDDLGLYERDDRPPTFPCGDIAAASPASRRAESAFEALLASVPDPRQRAAWATAIRRQQAKLDLIRQAVAGTGNNEITLLSYPLYVDKRWIVRYSPRFEYTIEALDQPVVPAGTFAALRIRIDSELFTPADRVHVWYGPSGLIRLHAKGESVATDDFGEVIGRLLYEQTDELTDLSLNRP